MPVEVLCVLIVIGLGVALFSALDGDKKVAAISFCISASVLFWVCSAGQIESRIESTAICPILEDVKDGGIYQYAIFYKNPPEIISCNKLFNMRLEPNTQNVDVKVLSRGPYLGIYYDAKTVYKVVNKDGTKNADPK